LYQQLLAKMKAEGLPRPQRRGTDSADLLPLARNRAFKPVAFRQLQAISQILGYRLEEEVGRGAMAVVYRAYDPQLDRRVALKVLAHINAQEEEFRLRFIREARAAALVRHPNIIPIYEAREAEGLLFISMHLVEGHDVQALINQQHQLPADRVGNIITQIASALDTAHARGLLHGNVDPTNMLLEATSGPDQPEQVYLSGFGLSRRELAGAGSDDSQPPLGRYMLAVRYMAPEQVRGYPPEERTDVYLLACSAFEMLAGRPPFAQDDFDGPIAFMEAILSNLPPPLTGMRADLPEAIDQVMDRALAKAPDDRYRTCREFADALRQSIRTGLG